MKRGEASAVREAVRRQTVAVTWSRLGRRGPWLGRVRADTLTADGRHRVKATIRSERADGTLRNVLIWLADKHPEIWG